jgi:hypothetical protein
MQNDSLCRTTMHLFIFRTPPGQLFFFRTPPGQLSRT